MKKCTVGIFTEIVVFLLFAAFFLPMTGVFLYLAIFGVSLPTEERILFAVGAVIFGGFFVFYVCRKLRGVGWLEYDETTVIFHFSKTEEYCFRWSDIPGDTVGVGPWQGGYMFIVRIDGKQRKLGLNRFSSNFKNLERTLEMTGVLNRIGVTTVEDFKRAAEQAFVQFEKRR